MRVRFGDCVLDSGTRELFRGDERVHLPPTGFRLLELLLENRPRAVAKAEIHEKIWPGTFVSEATLASAISDIRAAVGDDGRDSSVIRTVHGFGYAFSGQATDSKASATEIGTSCLLLWEDREIPLTAENNLLGRGEDVAVRITDNSVSRHHARITVRGESATLEDLESKNGTFVGPLRINQPTGLHDGDEIRLGDVVLTFRSITAAASTETVENRKPIGRRDRVPGSGNRKNALGKRRNHG